MGEMADYYMEQDMWRAMDDDNPDEHDEHLRDTKEPFPMLKKTTKKPKTTRKAKTIQDYAIEAVDKRPKLIHCGNHLIDPNDVVCITKTSKKDLYIVKLRSNPNPEYPIWTNERDIASLVKHFNIITE